MELRYYQKEAVTATVQALKDGMNPATQLPTGAGKSLVIAHLASKFAAKGGRMLVVTHVKELVQQNEATLRRYSPDTNTGVVCAGLNRDEPDASIVFASIQSIFKRGPEFMARGLNIIAIDEAHLVPPDGEGLMYKRFLSETNVRRMGFSATPWRLDGGVIYGDERPFDVLAYEKPALDLVSDGYLAPLKGVQTEWQLDTSKIGKVGGDYNQAKSGEKITDEGWLEEALKNALHHVKDRKHCLVFCPTVKVARETAELLQSMGQTASFISAESTDREDLLAAWKAGEFKFMCNVDILTTGFDFPSLDAIVCFRPTQSSALWVQMLGRGMRIAAGKTDCLVLDYVGNLARLGGVDTMETWLKEKKGTLEETGKKDPDKLATTNPRRVASVALTDLDPMLARMSGLVVNVLRVSYIISRSSRQPGKNLLMACYMCETDEGVSIDVTQFVCVEYEGGARWHAEQWAKRRGYTNASQFPRDAYMARTACYALPVPRKLQIRRKDGFMEVLREIF